MHGAEVFYHPLFGALAHRLVEADEEIFGEVVALLIALETNDAEADHRLD